MAGEYIKDAKDKYISSMFILQNLDEIKRMDNLDLYDPITNNSKIHPEGVPDLSNDINLKTEQIAIDLAVLNKEIQSNALNFKGFILGVKNRLDIAKNKLEELKQRKEDADLISANYNDFNTIINLDQEMFSGNFSVENNIFAAEITDTKDIECSIEKIDGNGYEGNKYVINEDGTPLKDTMDTSNNTALLDNNLSTVYEYSRITVDSTEKIKCIDANIDNIEALCFITLKSDNYFQMIRVISDLKLNLNSVYTSIDGINFNQTYSKDIQDNSLQYSNSDFNGLIVFPATKYVKIGLESIGTTNNDIIAFDASIISNEETINNENNVNTNNVLNKIFNDNNNIKIYIPTDTSYKNIDTNSIKLNNFSLTNLSNNILCTINKVELKNGMETNSYITLPDTLIINNKSITLSDKINFPKKYIRDDVYINIEYRDNLYYITTLKYYIEISLYNNLIENNKYKLSLNNIINTDGSLSSINNDYVLFSITSNSIVLDNFIETDIKPILKLNLGNINLNQDNINNNYIIMYDEDNNIIDCTYSSDSNNIIYCTPKNNLNYDSKYNIIILSSATDINNNILNNNYLFTIDTKSIDSIVMNEIKSNNKSIIIETNLLLKNDADIYIINKNYNKINCSINIENKEITITPTETLSLDSDEKYIIVINKNSKDIKDNYIGTTYYYPITIIK